MPAAEKRRGQDRAANTSLLFHPAEQPDRRLQKFVFLRRVFAFVSPMLRPPSVQSVAASDLCDWPVKGRHHGPIGRTVNKGVIRSRFWSITVLAPRP